MQINTNAANIFIHLPDNGQGEGRKVLKMVQNDRMAGSVPSWQSANSAREHIATGLNTANLQPQKPDISGNALALNGRPNASSNADDSFGFRDLLDMVNPLQHIPIISSVYREISGDQIRPAARLIGGGLFGGIAGLASGLVNIIAEEETGRDLAGNAFHFVSSGEGPRYKNRSMANASPERALEQAISQVENESLPASMLAFTDQGIEPKSTKHNTIEQKVPFRAL